MVFYHLPKPLHRIEVSGNYFFPRSSAYSGCSLHSRLASLAKALIGRHQAVASGIGQLHLTRLADGNTGPQHDRSVLGPSVAGNTPTHAAVTAGVAVVVHRLGEHVHHRSSVLKPHTCTQQTIVSSKNEHVVQPISPRVVNTYGAFGSFGCIHR